MDQRRFPKTTPRWSHMERHTTLVFAQILAYCNRYHSQHQVAHSHYYHPNEGDDNSHEHYVYDIAQAGAYC